MESNGLNFRKRYVDETIQRGRGQWLTQTPRYILMELVFLHGMEVVNEAFIMNQRIGDQYGSNDQKLYFCHQWIAEDLTV